MKTLKQAAHTQRGHDEWGTPHSLFDPLNAEFVFTLDPCSTKQNALCRKHFTKTENGLSQSWRGHTVFMNPPFSTVQEWVAKAYDESLRGVTTVCLVPARVDTQWWHDFYKRAEIRWIRGRIKYVGGSYNAPFASCLLIFRGKK